MFKVHICFHICLLYTLFSSKPTALSMLQLFNWQSALFQSDYSLDNSFSCNSGLDGYILRSLFCNLKAKCMRGGLTSLARNPAVKARSRFERRSVIATRQDFDRNKG